MLPVRSGSMQAAMATRVIWPKIHVDPVVIKMPQGTALEALEAYSLVWTHKIEAAYRPNRRQPSKRECQTR